MLASNANRRRGEPLPHRPQDAPVHLASCCHHPNAGLPSLHRTPPLPARSQLQTAEVLIPTCLAIATGPQKRLQSFKHGAVALFEAPNAGRTVTPAQSVHRCLLQRGVEPPALLSAGASSQGWAVGPVLATAPATSTQVWFLATPPPPPCSQCHSQAQLCRGPVCQRASAVLIFKRLEL